MSDSRRSMLRRAGVLLACPWSRAWGSGKAGPADDPGRVWVAVGYGGRRMSTRDGRTWVHERQWSSVAADDDNILAAVAHGRGKFVAVGGGTKLGHFLVTRDGEAWREVGMPRRRVATIAFGGGRFVAGQSDRFLRSDDGERWTEGARLEFRGSIHFRRSAFGDGVFVAIGDCDPASKPRVRFRASTRDGATVASFEVGTPPAKRIAFGAGRFVVVGQDGYRESSTDGKTWGHREDRPGEPLHSVVWTGEEFFVAGNVSSYRSPDGISWTREAKGAPCDVLWAEKGLYLGASWGGALWASADGRRWEKTVDAAAPVINDIACGVPAPAPR